jgi:hypothetical protein
VPCYPFLDLMKEARYNIAKSRQAAQMSLLALVIIGACPRLLSQTILETQPETLPEQSHHQGWWPNSGSAPRSAYTGSQACAGCHAAEFAGWQISEMANALGPAAQSEFLRSHPHLSFEWGQYKYRIDLDKGEAIYSATDGTNTLSSPLLWAYGVGVVGQAFVFRDLGTYFEAEVAYYPPLSGLDVVAGLRRAAPATLQAAFGIPLVPMAAQQCISCHTTAAVVNGRLQVESAILGVSCEACHGPGARHVAAMKARPDSSTTPLKSSSGRALEGRGFSPAIQRAPPFSISCNSELGIAGLKPRPSQVRNPIPQHQANHVASLIFNPVSLRPADVEDFCGACHRTSLRVQGKGLHGLETVHYEPYRLELSSCWIMSQRITCLTCHNPHQPLARGSSSYDPACSACHSSGAVQSAAAGSAARSGKVCPVGKHDCTTCHMPTCRIPLSPFRMSDHFIRIVSADDACAQPVGRSAAGSVPNHVWPSNF